MTQPLFTDDESHALEILFDAVPAVSSREEMRQLAAAELQKKSADEPQKGLVWALVESSLEDLFRVTH